MWWAVGRAPLGLRARESRAAVGRPTGRWLQCVGVHEVRGV